MEEQFTPKPIWNKNFVSAIGIISFLVLNFYIYYYFIYRNSGSSAGALIGQGFGFILLSAYSILGSMLIVKLINNLRKKKNLTISRTQKVIIGIASICFSYFLNSFILQSYYTSKTNSLISDLRKRPADTFVSKVNNQSFETVKMLQEHLIAVISNDQKIYSYNAAEKKLVEAKELEHKDSSPYKIVSSPDGKYLATKYLNDDILKVFDTNGNSWIIYLERISLEPEIAIFSSDSSKLVILLQNPYNINYRLGYKYKYIYLILNLGDNSSLVNNFSQFKNSFQDLWPGLGQDYIVNINQVPELNDKISNGSFSNEVVKYKYRAELDEDECLLSVVAGVGTYQIQYYNKTSKETKILGQAKNNLYFQDVIKYDLNSITPWDS